MRGGFMHSKHEKTKWNAVIFTAAVITIISGILEIIEWLCRLLL